jgi:hypothetical protein
MYALCNETVDRRLVMALALLHGVVSLQRRQNPSMVNAESVDLIISWLWERI